MLINLISQIDNLELKEEYIKKLKKTLIKDETDKKMKSRISLDETLERFNKKKSKEITVNDLQHEITIIKKEIIDLKNVLNDNFDLKQEMLLLKIDKQLDNEQSDSEPDEQKGEDGPSQQAPLSNTAPIDNRLSLINRLIPPKCFSKVKLLFAMNMVSILLL